MNGKTAKLVRRAAVALNHHERIEKVAWYALPAPRRHRRRRMLQQAVARATAKLK